jgi:hypothetical protein
MMSVTRIVLANLAIVAGACVWLCGGASAASPEGMRLYVFSSGWLTLDKSGLQTGATGKITVPVAFFLPVQATADVAERRDCDHLFGR